MEYRITSTTITFTDGSILECVYSIEDIFEGGKWNNFCDYNQEPLDPNQILSIISYSY